MAQPADCPAIYINSRELLELLELPESYLYAVVREDDPRMIIGYGGGHIFRTVDGPEFRGDLDYYRLTLHDGRTEGLYADSETRAIWMMERMYLSGMVKLLEKEMTVRSIVWPSRSIEQ